MAADASMYAYRAPGGAAYQPPDADPTTEREPSNMDVGTHDVVRDQSRLGGARALPNLKERGA